MQHGWSALVAPLVVGMLVSTATPAAAAKRRAVECKTGYQFYELGPEKLKPTFKSMARNRGGATDSYTLTVTRSGTVSTTLSASIEAEVSGGFGVFSASLKTQFGISSTKEFTAQRGEQITVGVPAHRQVSIRYGVWTRRVKGLMLTPEPNTNIPPVRLPDGCSMGVLKMFSAMVATPETGFEKSKPRRYKG